MGEILGVVCPMTAGARDVGAERTGAENSGPYQVESERLLWDCMGLFVENRERLRL